MRARRATEKKDNKGSERSDSYRKGAQSCCQGVDAWILDPTVLTGVDIRLQGRRSWGLEECKARATAIGVGVKLTCYYQRRTAPHHTTPHHATPHHTLIVFSLVLLLFKYFQYLGQWFNVTIYSSIFVVLCCAVLVVCLCGGECG